MSKVFLSYLAVIGLAMPIVASPGVAGFSDASYVVGQTSIRDSGTKLDVGADVGVVLDPIENNLGMKIAANPPGYNPGNKPEFTPVKLGPERGFGNNDCRGDEESEHHTGNGKTGEPGGGNDKPGTKFDDDVIVGNHHGKCVSR